MNRRSRPPRPGRRPGASPQELPAPKLHKALAQAGYGSRLQMEQYIADGRISVNGKKAHVGQRLMPGDRVRMDGEPLRLLQVAPKVRVLLYHKEAGELVTRSDPQGRPTVFQRFPRLRHGKWQCVGRLDLNTEGLLLVTNSGELANRLMHPRFALEREYAVRVLGALSEQDRQRLLTGVELEDGPARFTSLVEVVPDSEAANRWYHVTLSEGRNREVRRMIESVGGSVSRLIRVRYGDIWLPRRLSRGRWQELSTPEVQALQRAPADARKTPDARPGARDRRRTGARKKQGHSPSATGTGARRSRRRRP